MKIPNNKTTYYKHNTVLRVFNGIVTSIQVNIFYLKIHSIILPYLSINHYKYTC